MKLPTTWQIKRLEKLVQFSSGGTPSKSKPEFWRGDIPWISAATMHQQEIVTSELHISEDGLKAGSKLAKENDLLLLVRGSMLWKKVPICICKRDVAFNQDVKAMSINGKVTPTYLLYWFLTHQQFLLNKVVGTGIGAGKFDLDELKALDILLPPLSEQKAIADLLSTWDEAIEKTERQIQTKEKQFKWLLQTLISQPQNTSKGAKWKKMKLGDVCKVTTGQSAPQDVSVFTDTGFPFVRVSSLDLLLGKATSVEKIEYISEENGAKLKMRLFQSGTLLFAKSGMSALLPRIFKLKEPSFVVSHLCALIPKKSIHENYLMYYLMKFHPNRLIQGAGFPSIKTSEVSALKISLPPMDIQQQISDTLSTSQHEIDLMKQILEKYKTQKRGLMQKLLTGKWRVKYDSLGKYQEV